MTLQKKLKDQKSNLDRITELEAKIADLDLLMQNAEKPKEAFRIMVTEKMDTWEGGPGNPSNQHLISLRNVIAEKGEETKSLKKMIYE